ncbi:MAG: NAD-dependent protein deacylase [Pirellulaceae bacterium]|nr:NAD-dependent protein deacylase [Pirellulaceae bacterium]
MDFQKPSASQSQAIDEIVNLLNPQTRILAVTGAGMSADSGLPTYRGVGGLYNSGETEQGMTIEQLLSGSTFRNNPNLTWKYLGQIGKACGAAKFNRGHELLAIMEHHFEDFCVLTQNIDGFHRDAGSQNLIEIHGNLHHLKCEACDFQKQVDTFEAISIPPLCDQCQSLMRPKVVLFNEMLGRDSIAHLTRQWQAGFDVVFSIGTTSVFPYIAEPVLHCHQTGKVSIEINPTETQVSNLCTYRLPLPATIVLEEIWARYSNPKKSP